jgi:Sec-independent protein secretion pathway component TatC
MRNAHLKESTEVLSEPEPDDGRMGFLEHLDEFRTRLIRSFLAVARMRMVTARFLLRQVKYAVLIGFAAAAVLTPSPDPWNQTLFAIPMIALYIISIGIAWIVAPRKEESKEESASPQLRLVFAATVIDSALRHAKRPEPSRSHPVLATNRDWC